MIGFLIVSGSVTGFGGYATYTGIMARTVEQAAVETAKEQAKDLQPVKQLKAEAERNKKLFGGPGAKGWKNPIAVGELYSITDGTFTVKRRGIRSALNTLNSLDVRGKAPMTGYSRDKFGQAWSDAAGDFKGWTKNGCDSRNDALGRDLSDVTFKAGTHDCKVLRGTWKIEPYTGAHNRLFVSGGSYAQELDIDHRVPLGWAWAMGAWKWTDSKRAALANDPANLISVDPSANRQKGDSGPASWLPANKQYRCTYVVTFVKVAAKYDLGITKADKATSKDVLRRCL